MNRVSEIRRRLAGTTLRTWSVTKECTDARCNAWHVDGPDRKGWGYATLEDAAFIANAPQDVRFLLDGLAQTTDAMYAAQAHDRQTARELDRAHARIAHLERQMSGVWGRSGA